MTSFEPIAPSPPTHHASLSQRSLQQHRPFSDPNRLAPEDAFLAHSPPRTRREQRLTEAVNGVSHGATQFSTSDDGLVRRKRDKDRGRSGSRRRKGEWKRLLWVRHPGCTNTNGHYRGEASFETNAVQTPTTTLTHQHFSPICSAIRVCSSTISGRWSQTPQSLFSTSAPSRHSSAAS